MTNLLNVLKTMETETTGVKNDVINFLLEDVKEYSPQDKLQDLLSNGCESGMVNHLIYYKDTVQYFEDHEKEIMEMLESFGIENVETEDGIEQLAEMFPELDNVTQRQEEAEEEVREKAENETPEAYGDEWDEMDEDEQIEAIQEYASNIMMYDVDPMKLIDHDKNYLAWAIFEYNASVLFDELDEMELIK